MTSRFIIAIAGLALLCGCPEPPAPDNSNDVDNGANPSDPILAAGADALQKAAYSVIVARVEDLSRIGGRAKRSSRSQSILDFFNGPCLNGGTRGTDPDGTMSFDGCAVFPGVELNGGIQFVPDPRGGIGGRIDFYDVYGTNNGTEFRIDGSIEEFEDENGDLTFRFDLRSSTDDGEYNDEFNVRGEIKVGDDGEVFGELLIDTGNKYDYQRPSRCQFEGQNIFDLVDEGMFGQLCQEEEFVSISAADPPMADDPAGVQLALDMFAEIRDDEPVLAILQPSATTPNTLFGMQFENARVYAQLDAVGLNIVGYTVEDRNGRYLYTFENRRRGFTMTLATGDVMRIDARQDDAVEVHLTLNSTLPPSTIAMRLLPDGTSLMNESSTRIYTDPNPEYGIKSPPAPAKHLQRASIRLGRSGCKDLVGKLRALGNGVCDLKDLLTGTIFERVPDGLCAIAKRIITLAAHDVQKAGVANLSLTVYCVTLKAIGMGGKFAESLTPPEIGCKILTIASELSQTFAAEEIESLICNAVLDTDWHPNRVEIIGFINADGSTEKTPGAVEDARIINFGVDPAIPIFDWSTSLVPRADFIILTAEYSGNQELYYWLARDRMALPRNQRYGHYNAGIPGVSNVPYPAPPLLELPAGGFYRLKIRLEDGTNLETRFRMLDSREGVLVGNVGEAIGKKSDLFGDLIDTSPVAGATVKLLSGTRVLGQTTTDGNGDYRIGSLPQGSPGTLRVEKEGYAAAQLELTLASAGETRRNLRVAPLSGCNSDLDLIEPLRGPLAREVTNRFLVEGNASGVDPAGLMICVSGSRSNVVVSWNDAWVADHMRAVDGSHVGDRSDQEFRVVSVRLNRVGAPGNSLVAQRVNYIDMASPVELNFDDNRILLEPGAEYTVSLDTSWGARS